MKHLLSVLAVLAVLVVSLGLVGLYSAPTAALTTGCKGFDCITTNEKEISKETGQTNTVESLAKRITNTFLYLIGALGVIMLIYGGIQYVISNGDSNAITKAKNTILYAIIGIAIALLAFAIVNFVSKAFNAAPNSPDSIIKTPGAPTTSKPGVPAEGKKTPPAASKDKAQ